MGSFLLNKFNISAETIQMRKKFKGGNYFRKYCNLIGFIIYASDDVEVFSKEPNQFSV